MLILLERLIYAACLVYEVKEVITIHLLCLSTTEETSRATMVLVPQWSPSLHIAQPEKKLQCIYENRYRVAIVMF